MEALVAAAGVVLIAIASIFGAIFQAKKRGRAEGEIERHKDRLEIKDSIIEDVNLAQQARDAVRRDNRKPGSLRDDPYNRDEA
jgi:hypothetical protein